MNPKKSTPPPSHSSLENFRKFTQLRDVLPRTVRSYSDHLSLLARHYGADPATLTEDQIRDYFHFLRTTKNYRPGSMAQAKVAIRIFYHDFLKIDPRWDVFAEVKVRRPTLPNVLSKKEVRTLLGAFDSPRFRTYFSLIYACGLRRSEALSIEVRDIDSPSGRLHIRKGKGDKQRYVPISNQMIAQLRTWWKYHRNPSFIFPSCSRRWRNRLCPQGTEQGLLDFEPLPHWRRCTVGHPANEAIARRAAMHRSAEPMGVNTVQEAMRMGAKHSGIAKRITPHTLRHCYATHLLEDGVSLRHISEYLGHASLVQTATYLHLTRDGEKNTYEALNNLHETVINPIL